DYGSRWSVSNELPGSNGEKWVLSQASDGTVYDKSSLVLSYYHQPAPSLPSRVAALSQILSVAIIFVAAGVVVSASVILLIYQRERRRKAIGPSLSPTPPEWSYAVGAVRNTSDIGI